MKNASVALAILVCAMSLALSACGEQRPTHTNAEARESHQRAAGEANKSFDKEHPADPAAMK